MRPSRAPRPEAVECFATGRFKVMRLPLPLSNGGVMEYTYIRPKNGVVVLPVLADGRIILIRNRRLPVGAILWELPAGVIEDGEDPASAAAREVEEETGYRAAHLEPLPSLFTSPGLTTEKQFVFAATGLALVGQNLDETELLEAHAMTMEVAVELARLGEIQDARCMAVLLWWARFGREAAVDREGRHSCLL